MNFFHSGFVILSFLMLFTTGFAYGSWHSGGISDATVYHYDGIDGWEPLYLGTGGIVTVEGDELKIVKPKGDENNKLYWNMEVVCAVKVLPSYYDYSKVEVSFFVRQVETNGKVPFVNIDGQSFIKPYGFGKQVSITSNSGFTVSLCLEQTVSEADPKTIWYSDVKISVSEYIPPQSSENIIGDIITSTSSPNILEQPTSTYPQISPLKDTDGDNYPDIRDRCPNEYGPSGSSGCPTTNEPPYLMIIISIIVISVIILIVKSKKSRERTRTQTGSSYSSANKKQKTSKKSSGSYSSSKRISQLRDFRKRPDYVPIEDHYQLRKKYSTDEDIDELIRELESNAESDSEFQIIEGMVEQAILIEFSHRRNRTSNQDDGSERRSYQKEEYRADPKLVDAYDTLELPVGTKWREVKARKRQLALKHHPDRIKDKKLKKKAQDIMTEINNAVDLIEKSFQD